MRYQLWILESKYHYCTFEELSNVDSCVNGFIIITNKDFISLAELKSLFRSPKPQPVSYTHLTSNNGFKYFDFSF